MKLITSIIAFISFSTITCFANPDSISIRKNIYSPSNPLLLETDSLIDTELVILKRKRVIKKLVSQINDFIDFDQYFSEQDLDTVLIKSKSIKLLNFYSDKEKFEWNKHQLEFIFKKLNLEAYKMEFKNYLNRGSNYSMHNFYKEKIVIQFFENGVPTNAFTSRKHIRGFRFPWTNSEGEELYNLKLENTLRKILNEKTKFKRPHRGVKLLKYLTTKIIDKEYLKLYELSALTYQKEIKELESHFNVLSATEVYTSGRYNGYSPDTTTLKITLNNSKFPKNVFLQFLCTKPSGEHLYSRDSIKKEYKGILHKVQSIKFISNHLKENPKSTLDIYYFNNNSISEHTIYRVNTNPTEWKKYEESLKRYEFYKNNNIQLSFNIDKAKAISKSLYCGCNYRFEKSFIEKAIFFELKTTKGSSIWLLLPNDLVLLYLKDGENLVSDLTSEKSIFRSYNKCYLYDLNGKQVRK